MRSDAAMCAQYMTMANKSRIMVRQTGQEFKIRQKLKEFKVKAKKSKVQSSLAFCFSSAHDFSASSFSSVFLNNCKEKKYMYMYTASHDRCVSATHRYS